MVELGGFEFEPYKIDFYQLRKFLIWREYT